jgi:hypothetical protein
MRLSRRREGSRHLGGVVEAMTIEGPRVGVPTPSSGRLRRTHGTPALRVPVAIVGAIEVTTIRRPYVIAARLRQAAEPVVSIIVRLTSGDAVYSEGLLVLLCH